MTMMTTDGMLRWRNGAVGRLELQWAAPTPAAAVDPLQPSVRPAWWTRPSQGGLIDDDDCQDRVPRSQLGTTFQIVSGDEQQHNREDFHVVTASNTIPTPSQRHPELNSTYIMLFS